MAFMVKCAQVIRKANNKMSGKLIYTGKAKDIYTTEDENVIKSVYKDQATMLNGARKETIKGKGVLNNQISSLIFEKLNTAGVATHFIERISDTEQLNKKVKIIPLEVVLRNVTAGSFSKRFGVEEGLELEAETRRINELLKDWFAQIGLRLIDFKLEFGFDKDGKIILADEFSPDNCRLWDAEGHHMDKDVFRRDLGSLTDVYEVVLEKLQGLK